VQSLRNIKRRIKVVQNIEHITRAMKMISAAKLQRAQREVEEARPYARKIREILRDLNAVKEDFDHPLLKERPVNRACYVVLTSDQGLCGGYNTNVLHEAEFALRQEGAEVEVIAVGAKAKRYLTRLGYAIAASYPGCSDKVLFQMVRLLTERVSSDFISGRYDAVYFVYNRFYSVVTQKPVVRQVLPVDRQEVMGPVRYRSIYHLEPSAEEVLNDLLPRYLAATIYRIFLEAKAAEHGARVTAMDAATDNAEELMAKLKLSYNRARQAAITEELTEIIAGADALKEEVGLKGE
jgi:F-type H+-transporting ATPase subunit gamma